MTYVVVCPYLADTSALSAESSVSASARRGPPPRTAPLGMLSRHGVAAMSYTKLITSCTW